MKAKKIISLALCAVMLVALSVAGTLAYLTDTESVENTFTVGKVYIDLWETKTDLQGNSVKTSDDANEITRDGNAYHLLPGHTYTKDPMVTVLKDSEECYVRMIVTATFDDVLTDAELATELDSVFTGYDATVWPRNDKKVETVNGKTAITYEFRYAHKVAKNENADTPLPALFTAIAVPGTWTNDQIDALNKMEMNIVAHAIQAAGFDDAGDAWSNF